MYKCEISVMKPFQWLFQWLLFQELCASHLCASHCSIFSVAVKCTELVTHTQKKSRFCRWSILFLWCALEKWERQQRTWIGGEPETSRRRALLLSFLVSVFMKICVDVFCFFLRYLKCIYLISVPFLGHFSPLFCAPYSLLLILIIHIVCHLLVSLWKRFHYFTMEMLVGSRLTRVLLTLQGLRMLRWPRAPEERCNYSITQNLNSITQNLNAIQLLLFWLFFIYRLVSERHGLIFKRDQFYSIKALQSLKIKYTQPVNSSFFFFLSLKRFKSNE